MKIAGLVKTSFVDYPGKIAATIFLPGCNYDCFFCHNRQLLEDGGKTISREALFAFLSTRQGRLDGIVVTGGEPTLHHDLAELLAQIKALGYLVKLDTNGSHPEVIRAIIAGGLVDYIAMDVKAPLERYPDITGHDALGIVQSLDLLRAWDKPYEIRTTFLPELTVDDIFDIARSIAPVVRFALQEYRVPQDYPAQWEARIRLPRHTPEDFEAAARAAKACGGEVVVRR